MLHNYAQKAALIIGIIARVIMHGLLLAMRIILSTSGLLITTLIFMRGLLLVMRRIMRSLQLTTYVICLARRWCFLCRRQTEKSSIKSKQTNFWLRGKFQ